MVQGKSYRQICKIQTGSPAAIAFGQGIFQRVYSKAACFGAGDFKHGNIYAFIMGTDLWQPPRFFSTETTLT